MDMINEMMKKLKQQIEKMFEEKTVRIEEAESYLEKTIQEAVCKLLEQYYTECENAFFANKQERKRAGLVRIRSHDKRHVETRIGPIDYRRGYYRDRNGKYCYPVDEIAGVTPYMRMSDEAVKQIVEAATKMSYARASRYTMSGKFSRQTVMNKVRAVIPEKPKKAEEQRKVKVLHIDADEDHVNLHSGGNTIVPLISIYEGIERIGKRGKCMHIQHYSDYGKGPAELWDEALSRIEAQYDLENTKFYLHGDGAGWIRTGLQWLPNAQFVLDRYHFNKALKTALAGLTGAKHAQYSKALKDALYRDDLEKYDHVCEKLKKEEPYRTEASLKSLLYLRTNIHGIAIYKQDNEAHNGGCTEPHVSHVLSSRLSSRPMTWSEETLTVMSQLLSGANFKLNKPGKDTPSPQMIKAAKHADHAARRKLGLPDPDIAHNLYVLRGHSTPLSDTIRAISYGL